MHWSTIGPGLLWLATGMVVPAQSASLVGVEVVAGARLAIEFEPFEFDLRIHNQAGRRMLVECGYEITVWHDGGWCQPSKVHNVSFEVFEAPRRRQTHRLEPGEVLLYPCSERNTQVVAFPGRYQIRPKCQVIRADAENQRQDNWTDVTGSPTEFQVVAHAGNRRQLGVICEAQVGELYGAYLTVMTQRGSIEFLARNEDWAMPQSGLAQLGWTGPWRDPWRHIAASNLSPGLQLEANLWVAMRALQLAFSPSIGSSERARQADLAAAALESCTLPTSTPPMGGAVIRWRELQAACCLARHDRDGARRRFTEILLMHPTAARQGRASIGILRRRIAA